MFFPSDGRRGKGGGEGEEEKGKRRGGGEGEEEKGRRKDNTKHVASCTLQ